MKTENRHPYTTAISAAALALWLLCAVTMALHGTYQPGLAKPPLAFGLTLLVPFLILAILYRTSPSFHALAQRLDLRLLVALNLGRVLGADFLLQYAHGRLPAAFAFPAGLGDILVGLTALPLLLAISGHRSHLRPWFIAWNLFGLADLLIAVGSGILHSESALGLLAGAGPTTLLMSQFPRALIPTFLVPIYLLLHLLALARSREVSRHTDDTNAGKFHPAASRSASGLA